MITDKELEKMGIIHEGSKLKPDRYWCNTTQTQMRIDTKTATIESVMTMIFEEGYTQGISTGKTQRSTEIKRLLNNEDLF